MTRPWKRGLFVLLVVMVAGGIFGTIREWHMTPEERAERNAAQVEASRGWARWWAQAFTLLPQRERWYFILSNRRGGQEVREHSRGFGSQLDCERERDRMQFEYPRVKPSPACYQGRP